LNNGNLGLTYCYYLGRVLYSRPCLFTLTERKETMIPEAYKAYVQINGKWELIAWGYRFEQFKERLSEAKKLYPNQEIRKNFA
jgi:hypothetical protein